MANPEVPPTIDTIVMQALERDPRQRCSSAASLRTQIQAQIPAHVAPADNRAVVEWITAAFAEKQPRAKVMTPVIASPAVTLPAVMTATPSFPPAPVRGNPRTLAIAGGVLLVVIGVIVAMILR